MQRFNASRCSYIDDVLERYRDNIDEARAAARERARKSAELAYIRTEVQAGLATPEQIKEMVINQNAINPL